MTALAVAMLAAAIGFARWRREDRPRWTQWAGAGAGGLAAAAAAWVWPAAAAGSLGILVGAGLAWGRPVDRSVRAEGVWLVAVAVAAGAGAALVGPVMLAGLGVGGAAAAWVREAGAGRLTAPPALQGRPRPYRLHVLVCVDGPCQRAGAAEVRAAMAKDPRFRAGAGVRVTASGCLGRCADGPICWIEPAGTLRAHVERSSLDDLLATSVAREGPA